MLDDGTTQIHQFSYDSSGYFNLTQVIDPLGRKTNFNYSNDVDLAAISQTTAHGIETTVAQFTYNTQHRPTIYTDAAGQSTFYSYNAVGQLTSVTNALSETTEFGYDTSHNLSTVINANNVTATTFTYDDYARIKTYTDSEGWTVTLDYDAADRIAKITYPDGTASVYTYDRLDLVSYRDRQGRTWSYSHDANRRLTKITDPLGQETLLGYNREGKLTSLTDPKGYTTIWSYDVQGRLITKQYADTSTITYTYENTTSRLKSVTDALGQVKQYSYAKDNRLIGISYQNAVNPTPNVSFTYDPYFPRLVSMTDGNGTTQYTYALIGSLGALKLIQEASPLPSSAITYAYDELGRTTSRTVAGSGAETFEYDVLGRLITHTSDLGSFALSYLGETSQVTQRQLLPPGSSLATTWSYLNNMGDRRLAEIANAGLSVSQFSTYQFTTTRENLISAITETSDTSLVYPGTGTQTASYNNLNQLTNLSGQSLSYDSNGNLLSDGQRNYSWDAESRLVSISYPGQAGKQTDFAYDGLGRRTAITSTPVGGGSAVTTSYLWCGIRICQARDAGNSPTRGYYDEGEFVPGTPGQTYYYGADQIGSVRRSFASTTNAPAYSYDPYGVALQGTTLLTDFGYASMFYNADSGLYLTQYRVYDPVAGRWLSRDPIGEASNRLGATISVSPADAVGTSTTLTSDGRNMEAAHSLAFRLVNSGGGLRNNGSFEIFGPQGVNAYRSLLPFSLGPDQTTAQYNLYQYVNANPVSYFDPRGDQWANVAGAAAGFAGGVLGGLFSQGIGQTGRDGSPCPINVMQALNAGIAGGLVGAANPVAGVSSFVGVILIGTYTGVAYGALNVITR